MLRTQNNNTSALSPFRVEGFSGVYTTYCVLCSDIMSGNSIGPFSQVRGSEWLNNTDTEVSMYCVISYKMILLLVHVSSKSLIRDVNLLHQT